MLRYNLPVVVDGILSPVNTAAVAAKCWVLTATYYFCLHSVKYLWTHVQVDPTRFCFYGDQRLLCIQNGVGSFCYYQNFPISENRLLNHRIQGVM